MKKVVDPETLEIKIIEDTKVNRKYIYLLLENGIWDSQLVACAEVYSSFETALLAFRDKISQAQTDALKYYDEYQLEDDTKVNSEKESAVYNIYKKGDSLQLDHYIKIEKKEVK